jgi:DNA-binding transcriptional regulator GbsR (MarR family)
MTKWDNEFGPKASKAVELIVEATGQLFEDFGYRGLVGKVWALLLFSPEPVDVLFLREKLAVSSGAMSMALKELSNLGLVYRETVAGQRRFYYRAETDFWIVATQVYREHTRARLLKLLSKIKEAEGLLAAYESEVNGQARLEQIRRLVSAGEFVVDLLDAIMERTKVELKAAQKWLAVSGRIGGEPLSRIRRVINASRLERSKRSPS